MELTTFFFYFLSAIAILSSVMVTLSRNAVNGAMYMILCLIATAGLFGMLQSYFLAALQVLVYAGAIMVLFVFIIMLLDVDAESHSKLKPFSLGAAALAAVLMILGAVGLFTQDSLMIEMPEVVVESGNFDAFSTEAQSYGAGLFGKYLLPIQVMGFLLLLAMVGVIHVSKDLWSKLQSQTGTNKETTDIES